MPFYRYLDLNGDGTGSKDMAVNGSVTPQVFKIAPKGYERFITLERMIVHVVDSGSFDSGSFGNGINLTNGVTFAIHNATDDSIRQDLLDGLTIIDNPDWGRSCFYVVVSEYGAGNETLTARWTFSKAGSPIVLGTDAYLAMTINDNLTGLVEMYAQIQGLSTE